MKKSTPLFIFLIFLLGNSPIIGQDLKGNNWYFGNSSEGIRFNKSNDDPNLINHQGTPFGTGGSAVATDPITGDLLFYTDGHHVYDASHNIMAGAGNLGAQTDINQPVAICPVPGNAGQYYIFSNDPGTTITASVVDMNAQGNAAAGAPPLGEVASPQAFDNALSTSTAMMVIKGEDTYASTYFLVIQDNNSLRSFNIEEFPAALPINTVYDPNLNAGSIVYNEVKQLMAVFPELPNQNIKTFQFDPENGGFTISDTIMNSGRSGEVIYDGAWSPDGEILYFSRSSTGNDVTGQIYQYHTDFMSPQPVLEDPVYRSYGLQTGPDGKLYHLYLNENNSVFEVGRIENPNVIDSVDYTRWQSGVNFNGRQFPQFTPQEDVVFTLLDFEVVDSCANNRTKFVPDVEPAYDSLVWNIADTSIQMVSPELTFEQGGDILVSLIAYLNGVADTVERTVTIVENTLEINLVSDTTVCASAFPGFSLTAEVSGGSGGEQLVWSHGQTGETATFDSTGTYFVVAEGDNGCTTYASVNIRICQEEKRVGNIWFFGEKAGIDFNPETPQPLPDSSEMIAPAGASAISDRNGQILFYTNGSTVWNKENEVMMNGNDIGGDSLSTQSALIVPFPGDATRYYIFTTDVAYGDMSNDLRYSIVDIRGDDGRGVVEPSTKGSHLFSKSTEKITAVEKGDTTWLLMHEFGNNTFRAYPVSAGGIGSPILSSIGSDHASGNAGNAKGYMKYSTDGSKVAAAVQGPPGFVELFNFSDTTGELTDDLKIELAGEEPYGVAFSPDNEKLYIATASNLYQYHIHDSLSNEEILASQKNIAVNGAAPLGALQLGPNGQIYLAQNGVSEVLVINGPNTLETDTSHVSVTPFALEGPNSRLGLPNFVQSIMEPISDGDFDFANQCLGEETQLTAVGRCDTDEFEWVIKNAANQVIHRTEPSKTTEAYFEFPEPGLYDVSLIISNPCAIPADTTITKDVEIFAPPAEPEFSESIGLCDGDTVLTAGPASAGLAYLWNTGATENEITVTRPGNYSVTITDTLTGCTTFYETAIENAGPEVDLGSDLILCQGDDPVQLNAGNSGATYAWEVIDPSNQDVIRSGNRREFNVSTSTAGDYIYSVTVTSPDPFNCVTRDSIRVTINPSPSGVASGSTVISCGATDGTISLAITSDGSYTYELFDAEDNPITTPSNINGPVSGEEIANGLTPGAYYVVLTDNVTGCESRLETAIDSSDPNQFTITPIPPTEADCSDAAVVTVNLSATAAFPVRYILNGTTEEGDHYVTSPPVVETTNDFTVTPIPPGTYVLEVTDDNGCVASESILIEPVDEEPLEIDGTFDICYEGTIESDEYATVVVDESVVTQSYNYLWENISEPDPMAGIVTIPPTQVAVAISAPGTYRLTRTLASDPTCISDTTFEIAFTEVPSIDFTLGEDCLGERTITANVSGDGSFNYLWSNGARTRTITVTESRRYSVQAINQSGCLAEQDILVEVNPEVTVRLTNSPACENEGMITLHAQTNIDAVTYTWTDSDGNILEQGMNLDSIQVADDGRFWVTVSHNGSDCEATDDIEVKRNAVGVSTLPETDVIICPSSGDPRRSEIFLNPDSTNVFTRYRWELDEQFISAEKIIKPAEPGLYRVTMTNVDGCIVEDDVRVILSCKPVLFVPNAIRPGSNIGPNKTFRIFTEDDIADEGFQVYIFNRWGEMIYQSRDKDFEWDGTFRGNPVPIEKYTYVIHYKGADDPSDEVYELKGGVTVLR